MVKYKVCSFTRSFNHWQREDKLDIEKQAMLRKAQFSKIAIFYHKFKNEKNSLNMINFLSQDRELNKISILLISGQIDW